jgi:tetratricopeptide (TPR) repeat protein
MRTWMVGKGMWLPGLLAAALMAGCAGTAPPAPVDTGATELAQGKAAMLAGDAPRAKAALNASLRKHATPEAWYYLATVEHHAGDAEAAQKAISESLRLEPTAQALLLKGTLLEAGDPEAALLAYRMGIERAAPDGLTRAYLGRNLGLALARIGQPEEALAAFQSYVVWAEKQGRPLTDPERAAWGLLLYQQSRDEAALKAWGTIRDRALREQVLTSVRSLDLGVARDR